MGFARVMMRGAAGGLVAVRATGRSNPSGLQILPAGAERAGATSVVLAGTSCVFTWTSPDGA